MSDPANGVRALGGARQLNIPVHALVELTHRCNLRCFHCYVDPDPRAELSTDEVIAILDQLADAGTLFLTLTGGEIMSRRDLWDIVEYARQRRFAVRLFTNATLLDEEAIDRIAGLRVFDVSVSIYGANRRTHDRVTRVPGSFERSTSAMRRLHERGVVTRLKCVLMADNYAEREAIGDLADELGAIPMFDPQLTVRNDGDASALEHRLDDRTLSEIVLNEQVHGEVPAETPTCAAGRDTVAISPSGIVNPCVQMPFPLGDLRSETFEQAWNGPRARKMREITFGRLSACAACEDASYCNPCLGMNLLETGDATRPSSSVCRVARARRRGVMA